MAKIDHTPATKRDITNARKESANLWEALTSIECNVNGIINVLLAVGCTSDQGVWNEAVEMTLEQADKLREVRERLSSYDDQPFLKGD